MKRLRLKFHARLLIHLLAFIARHNFMYFSLSLSLSFSLVSIFRGKFYINKRDAKPTISRVSPRGIIIDRSVTSDIRKKTLIARKERTWVVEKSGPSGDTRHLRRAGATCRTSDTFPDQKYDGHALIDSAFSTLSPRRVRSLNFHELLRLSLVLAEQETLTIADKVPRNWKPPAGKPPR